MADLTYLNDASVLATLRDRYSRWLIYVCSSPCLLDIQQTFLHSRHIQDCFAW